MRHTSFKTDKIFQKTWRQTWLARTFADAPNHECHLRIESTGQRPHKRRNTSKTELEKKAFRLVEDLVEFFDAEVVENDIENADDTDDQKFDF